MSRVVVNEIEAKVGNDISFNDAVKIDTIKGKTTAGSITIQGEGTATTNLQQGLCKAWANTSGSGTPVVDDSFNNASITDNGTGDQTLVFTNNMANSGYSCTMAPVENAIIALVQLLGQSSSQINPKSHSTSNQYDIKGKNYSVNGDLA